MLLMGWYHKKVCDVHGYNIMKKRILSIILTILVIFGTGILPDMFFETSLMSLEVSAANTNQTASAVKLSTDTISYSGLSNAPKIIPCETLGGIYFLNGTKLMFYNTGTGSSTFVNEFKTSGYTLSDTFASGSLLYILENSNSSTNKGSSITVYNLISQKTEQTINFDKTANVIGVDASGRIYLSGYENDSYSIYLLSKSGTLLSTVKSEQIIYDFAGFDSTNGNFYVVGYMNWVYWGYDHDMHVLRAGNVKNNTITFNETYIKMICQSYWYERAEQADVLGNKYICIDNTYQSQLQILDSNTCSMNESTINSVLSLGRNNTADGDFDVYASVGVRTVYRSNSNSIITFKDNSAIAEYDLSTGSETASAITAYPVFTLMEYKGGIAAIEKNGDDFYYEYFPWTDATYVKINGNAVNMQVGNSTVLTAETDGTLSQNYTWTSSNPKIASVNPFGEVYAWKKGSTVITVTTQKGLKGTYTVKVTGDSSIKNPAEQWVSMKGQWVSNGSANNYSTYGKVVRSYLVENSDGTLSRVEYNGSNVIVETYSSDGKTLKNSKKLSAELELFGGFYSGKDYNYLVFGQSNEPESDSREVIRIVKYSKNWSRVASASIKGINTYMPFDAGSLRMTETDGKLYIYTCHEMYTSQDGYHHQANMTFVINEEDLTVLQSYYDVMNIAQAGYVSHSFNQFIQTDGTYIYRVDHGDANPRAISITRCDVNGQITDVSYTLPVSLSNVTGYNATGASIGGFELSSNECLIAGNAVDYTKSNVEYSEKRNVFVSITSKDLKKNNVIWLTKYTNSSDVTVYTPQLVKLNKDQFMVMWEEYNENTNRLFTKIVTIDSNGNLTSNIIKSEMRLSDCKPVLCKDGLIRWYAGSDSAPVMYAVHPFHLEAAAFQPKSISSTKAKLASTSYSYNGTAKTPAVTVTDNGITLKKNTDYTVSYKNNNAIGTATVTITGKGNYTGVKTLTFKINPAKVTSLKPSTSYSTANIKMSWTKVKGAAGYEVYRGDTRNGSYKLLKTVTTNACTNSGLKAGSKYYYKVRAYKTVNGKKVYGAYSDAKSMLTKPAAPSKISLSAGSRQVKISWEKSAGSNGYEVYMSTSKDGTYTKIKTANSSTFSYTKTGLTKGQKYYFKVKAYKTTGTNEKVYSGWSNVKAVTAK